MSRNKPSSTRTAIKLFISHAARYPQLLVPLLIVAPLNILISDFFIPLFTSQILQRISEGAFDPQHVLASFSGLLITIAILTPLSGIVGWRIAILLIWNLENRVIRDIAERVFAHLMNMSASFHANRFAGSLVSQANKLTGSYIRFADATIFDLLPLLTTVTAAMVILAPRVPLYAASLLTLATIYIVGAIYFARPVREANEREAEAENNQTGNLADSITNIMAVKSFAAADGEKRRYAKSTLRTYQATQAVMRSTTIRETYASIITSAISISALVIAVVGVGIFHTNIATTFLIVAYTGSIGARLWEFQNILKQYNRALGDAATMVEILAIEPEIKDPEHAEPCTIKEGKIEFKQVAFTHAGSHKDDTLFTDLSLTIQPGERIGLVGHSGSGKTTLTRILLRFSDIDDGEILIDGQNIAHITQDDLRRNLSYVPQEPLLFHRSLRENIAYGKPDATDEEIYAAAKKAYAHEFIEKLPEGYETLVGERGVKLSGGQRQRIAIARAMIKNAPILVLDEATSALDSESEQLIQQALWKLMEGRTAIVIAHRLSTIQRMDRIIVLDHGDIVEQGSHKELLERGGRYAKLWSHQSGGFMEEG